MGQNIFVGLMAAAALVAGFIGWWYESGKSLKEDKSQENTGDAQDEKAATEAESKDEEAATEVDNRGEKAATASDSRGNDENI